MNILSILLTVIVSAQLDSTNLMLGDQCDLHLQATMEQNEQVEFPVYGEQLIDGIEIVDRTIVDTVMTKNGKKQLNQYLTITSFRDSLFVIEPIPFVAGDETIFSQPLSINIIQPFVIDSAANAITDIKNIMKAPIYWWGIIRWILLGLLLIALAVAAYFLYEYLAKRRAQKQGIITEPIVLRPAEEVALEKLNEIKEKKIWLQGRQKDYHTDLTDVIREYITRRFDVPTAEKTSDEILSQMTPLLKEQKELSLLLKDMLRLADLVKFAKWQATPDENEKSLRDAYTFVNDTTVKVQDTEDTEADNAQKNDENKATDNQTIK